MCTLFKVDEIYVAMLSVQIRSYLWSIFSVFGLNTKKYGPEITPYLDTFHAVKVICMRVDECINKVNDKCFDEYLADY